MADKTIGDIDSKFRFVIVAAKRAKQLLKGTKPKVKSKSKNLIRIAQEEVQQGLIDYRKISPKVESEFDSEDDLFIGEDLGAAPGSVGEDIPQPAPPDEDKDQS